MVYIYIIRSRIVLRLHSRRYRNVLKKYLTFIFTILCAWSAHAVTIAFFGNPVNTITTNSTTNITSIITNIDSIVTNTLPATNLIASIIGTGVYPSVNGTYTSGSTILGSNAWASTNGFSDYYSDLNDYRISDHQPSGAARDFVKLTDVGCPTGSFTAGDPWFGTVDVVWDFVTNTTYTTNYSYTTNWSTNYTYLTNFTGVLNLIGNTNTWRFWGTTQ